jgi:hypothetical protein
MKGKIYTWVTYKAGTIALSLFSGIAFPLAADDLKADPPSAADLLNARETISVGGLRLRLAAYAWRDFMPMGMPDNSDASLAAVAAARGLIVSVDLNDEGNKPLPKSLHVEAVYVVQGDQIWQTSAIEERPDDSKPSNLGFVIRKGPQWEPGSFIDIFARIKGGPGDSIVLVIKHQIIERVM